MDELFDNQLRNIKTYLIDFRDSISNLEPFSTSKCSDSYINDAIKNCEGNHMSFPSPPVEVLEQLIKDSNKKPLFNIYPYSEKCCQIDSVKSFCFSCFFLS